MHQPCCGVTVNDGQRLRVSTHLYVVLVVVRIHHAVEYEIHTAAAPEKAIASNKKFRVAGGLPRMSDLLPFKGMDPQVDL